MKYSGYLSFFIRFYISKNISLNIAGAFKNFTARFRA
ncbi:MAG: hypothetical protein KR126chlam5_00937 [Candidatus Anoxychlamydiales bacterium]|nr:hypothetical protein [Candidatus Anoxychlamydiales bacterium]